MQTTLGIASSLLGFDLITAGARIATADADLSDYVAIAAVVATPAAAMAAFKAYKWARRFFKANTHRIGKLKTILHYKKFGSPPKPTVSGYDPKLAQIVEDIYKGVPRTPKGLQIGTGSTADAIRYTKATGRHVGDTDHMIKGRELINRLDRFLRRSPDAPPEDIKAVKMMIDDLEDALEINY